MASVTDDFAGSGAFSANWQFATGSDTNWGRSSGVALTTATTADRIVLWVADAFGSHVRVGVTLAGSGGDEDIGVAIAGSTGAMTGYILSCYTGGAVVLRLDGGSATEMFALSINPTVGDIVELELTAAGLLTAYVNGASAGSTTDTTYASGPTRPPGMFGFGAGASVDNFFAFDVGAATSILRQMIQHAA